MRLARASTGGRFFLKDAMMSVEIGDFYESVDYWVSSTQAESGDKPAEAVVLCIKEEYPTYEWIMKGMIERAGFRIDLLTNQFGLHSTFVCVKPCAAD